MYIVNYQEHVALLCPCIRDQRHKYVISSHARELFICQWISQVHQAKGKNSLNLSQSQTKQDLGDKTRSEAKPLAQCAVRDAFANQMFRMKTRKRKKKIKMKTKEKRVHLQHKFQHLCKSPKAIHFPFPAFVVEAETGTGNCDRRLSRRHGTNRLIRMNKGCYLRAILWTHDLNGHLFTSHKLLRSGWPCQFNDR